MCLHKIGLDTSCGSANCKLIHSALAQPRGKRKEKRKRKGAVQRRVVIGSFELKPESED
ncbi:hypothetical protein Ahy_A03g013176 isoform C [Arachis hypogaea]|uniref:Uncharacterized protein n=1 Tax=Arachis hypogaea TaxID=3818 RepID=A0A445DUU7_ARAHY|nr:hypothetical protein Ahy_A03g013176 isoform C [Arachis hypogaea]